MFKELFLESFEQNLNEVIKKEGDKYVVYSHDLKRKFGTYDTEKEAKKRLREIEYFKHKS